MGEFSYAYQTFIRGDAFKYINQYRLLNPNSGRFLSEDPIGFASGDTNLYNYVKNNPVAYSDPSGNGPVMAEMCVVGRNLAMHENLRNLEKEKNLAMNSINAQLAALPAETCENKEAIANERKNLNSLKSQLTLHYHASVAASFAAGYASQALCAALVAVPGP